MAVTPPRLPRWNARAQAALPHCPGKRQMLPLKSGCSGGMPNRAPAQQPGVWRCPVSPWRCASALPPPAACARSMHACMPLFVRSSGCSFDEASAAVLS